MAETREKEPKPLQWIATSGEHFRGRRTHALIGRRRLAMAGRSESRAAGLMTRPAFPGYASRSHMRYAPRLPSSADLVVIGGGVVGAATAFHASRAGLRTVVIEARPALCTLTTAVAAGAFRLQFDDRDELDLARESVRMFLSFEEITGQTEYRLGVRHQGYLWLAFLEETATRQRELVSRLHSLGQTDVEVLDGGEARQRFPYIAPDVLQARFRAGDGFLDTKQLTYGLASASRSEIVLDCRVTGFRMTGERVVGVKTTRGEVATGAVVIAAGPFSGVVAAWARIDLPVAMLRRHKLWTPGLAAVPADAPMTIDEETGAHWRPAFGGAWVLYPDPATPTELPLEAVPPDPGFAFKVLDPSSRSSVARTAPFWRGVWEHGAAHWVIQAGQYTVTPDRRPLIGFSGVEGLHVNAGYSGHGIMLAPAGSRLLIDLITDVADAASNPFAPGRSFPERPPPLL